MSPTKEVMAAYDFPVHRMQHFSLHGTTVGSVNALVNLEARPLRASKTARRFIVTKLEELFVGAFRDLIRDYAGGLLIILPTNYKTLGEEAKKHLEDLEDVLHYTETSFPVYFAEESPQLLQLYEFISNSTLGDQTRSAVEALLSATGANGFQLVTTGQSPVAQTNFAVTNVYGQLSGYGVEDQLPSIVIVAHYDAFGIVPSLSFGADSNGSGVIALLELARIFSKLYSNSRTHARFNIIFLLSGGGHFNYQGTKQWIEEKLDSEVGNILTDVEFVLCLDSIGKGNELYFHVSKPPKEGSNGARLYSALKEVSSLDRYISHGFKFEQRHKKINLAEETLAWEHQRFSIRRMPAFSLSHYEQPIVNHSITDTLDTLEPKVLVRNTQILVEAMCRYVYNISDGGGGAGSAETVHGGRGSILKSAITVDEKLVAALLTQLAGVARSQQLIDQKSTMLKTLEAILSRYLHEDVKRSYAKPDSKDPDFIFYNGFDYTLSAYHVKPAVFDLILASFIALYLGTLYLLLVKLDDVRHLVYSIIGKIKRKNKTA